MSTPVSHKGYEIEVWPAMAVVPEILYLHVGEEVPAAAVANAGRWEILVFGSGTDVVVVPDEAAAREYLQHLGALALIPRFTA